MKRVFLIVLDSFGIGAAPDAAEYGDQGSNTLAACFRSGPVPTDRHHRLVSSFSMTRRRELRARGFSSTSRWEGARPFL